MSSTAIEWTDAVWNPVIGCSPVSSGCLNCYAATMANRLQHNPKAPEYRRRLVDAAGDDVTPIQSIHDGTQREVRIAEIYNGRAVFTGDVRPQHDRLADPLRWKKPRRIFVNSMSDLFHKDVPFEFIDKVFAVMALCPQHTFQVLTKRPERMAEFMSRRGVSPDALITALRLAPPKMDVNKTALNISDGNWNLPHVWLGTSIEDQATADERIPHLLKCPAAVRFLSAEPLLGAVDLSRLSYGAHRIIDCLRGDVLRVPEDEHESTEVYAAAPGSIGLVIAGGESGPNARPCNIDWIRSIVAQCKAAGVPCFVKQLGSVPVTSDPVPMLANFSDGDKSRRWPSLDRKGGNPTEWPADLRVRELPGGAS